MRMKKFVFIRSTKYLIVTINIVCSLLDFVKSGNFNVILGDPMYRMALKWWKGLFLPLPQYSVSGEAHEALTEADVL